MNIDVSNTHTTDTVAKHSKMYTMINTHTLSMVQYDSNTHTASTM